MIRLFRRRRYATLSGRRMRELRETQERVIETRAPVRTRRFMPARIELKPALDIVQQLLGGPCTTVKIVRPTDNGPALTILHLDIRVDEWPNLSDVDLAKIARFMCVDLSDLRKAVDALCGGR